MKPFVEQFAKAIYGDYAELSLASFNEQKFLQDATEKITRLEAENAKLRAALEAIRDQYVGSRDGYRMQSIACDALEAIDG